MPQAFSNIRMECQSEADGANLCHGGMALRSVPAPWGKWPNQLQVWPFMGNKIRNVFSCYRRSSLGDSSAPLKGQNLVFAHLFISPHQFLPSGYRVCCCCCSSFPLKTKTGISWGDGENVFVRISSLGEAFSGFSPVMHTCRGSWKKSLQKGVKQPCYDPKLLNSSSKAHLWQ